MLFISSSSTLYLHHINIFTEINFTWIYRWIELINLGLIKQKEYSVSIYWSNITLHHHLFKSWISVSKTEGQQLRGQTIWPLLSFASRQHWPDLALHRGAVHSFWAIIIIIPMAPSPPRPTYQTVSDRLSIPPGNVSKYLIHKVRDYLELTEPFLGQTKFSVKRQDVTGLVPSHQLALLPQQREQGSPDLFVLYCNVL